MTQSICVVGLGEIGGHTLNALYRAGAMNLFGVEVDADKAQHWRDEGFLVFEKMPARADVYIITVWNTDQIFKVLAKIKQTHLVSIESTIDPSHMKEIRMACMNADDVLVTCPHRYNPNDPQHHIFNQDRVLGGTTEKATARGLNFYSQFMPGELLHVCSFEEAVLTKVIENAYRYMEIVIAQEIKEGVENYGQNFEAIRRLVNSKWNIDMREAREGVAGKCLPKDMGFLAKYLSSNFLDSFISRNLAYMKEHGAL